MYSSYQDSFLYRSEESALQYFALHYNNLQIMKRGHAVAQLFEVLRYKLEGRGFDSLWCHWNFH